MNKRQNLIERIHTQSDVTIEEIENLLSYLGFSCTVRGSHHVFRKQGFNHLTIPRKKPVKKPYLRELSAILNRLGYKMEGL
jgi:predicted RNA binding protein YcfA (HicA-like mRNA interferase family)